MTDLQTLNSSLQSKSNKKYAISMKKYMKNQFDFFGVRVPVVKEIFKNYISESYCVFLYHFTLKLIGVATMIKKVNKLI